MNVVTAMNKVYALLNANDLAGAQDAVMTIEDTHCVLPSSVFEQVLRSAAKAGKLEPSYATWCARAYGRKSFAALMAEIMA